MDNSNMSKLPIFKHLDQSTIGENINSFRKGEFGMYQVIKWGAIAGAGYALWVYVLPVVFVAIGQWLAIASTLALTVLAIIASPVIFKGMKRFTRFLHKMVIKHDPFGELENQRKKMIQNKETFKKAQGTINGLRNEMEVSSAESEDKAKKLEKSVTNLHKKATKTKAELDALVSKNGKAIKSSDEYVNLHIEYNKLLSEANRTSNMLTQSKDFVIKYGARYATMKKMSQKLKMVGAAMDIKISDFDVTIEMLKIDYDFVKKSKDATNKAKSVLGYTKGFEMEYALEVVTTTIAQDIAITAGNLQDINNLTASYDLDSDELYANLDTLANDIRVGNDPIVDASKYDNPDYKLNKEDRIQSGFQDIF